VARFVLVCRCSCGLVYYWCKRFVPHIETLAFLYDLELIVDALQMAVARSKPAPGLVHHSDSGVQYTSVSFGMRLEDEGLLPSMGRVGSAYDNALAESFVATLETQLLYLASWPTWRTVRPAILEYIAGFYNTRGGPSSLGHLDPAEFEEVRLEEGDVA
jgi:putative transposase